MAEDVSMGCSDDIIDDADGMWVDIMEESMTEDEVSAADDSIDDIEESNADESIDDEAHGWTAARRGTSLG